MGKTIEVFTDGSSYGDRVVEWVKQSACSRCTVLVYDAGAAESNADVQRKILEYGAASLPAIFINGKLISPAIVEKGNYGSMTNAPCSKARE
ncbi:glutaredoxin [Paenibacillus aurantiacus]|uniref:Glutaredoxin n=1 Tax=Paenibacillus aurantiacus TaxID=1936118 RepID=A0ABV5KM67_9BACL